MKRLWLALAFAGSACSFGSGGSEVGPDAGAGVAPGVGVGGRCGAGMACRAGLTCSEDRTCQPAPIKVPGSACLLSAECLPGNFCSPDGRCAPNGSGVVGAACTSEGDCAAGLVCNNAGASAACAPAGGGDLGAACAETKDCRGGLSCTGGKCQASGMRQPWTGARCPDEAGASAKVHFRVPRASDTGDDFYRLPFPNDIRLENGKVSLAGHPRPGPGVLPFDPVERYISAIEEDATGFGINQAVFFRFSRNPDFESMKAEGAVGLHDITPGSPDYERTLGHSWSATTAGGHYICPRFVAVRHGFGAPLRPGTTYAVVLSSAITDESGTALAPDEDFRVMLAAGSPADPDLAAAWRAYAPLRAWIADKKIDASGMVAAAVFTTERTDEPVARLREAVQAAPVPRLEELVRCGDGGKSPCDDGKTGEAHQRGCPAAPDPMFDEFQGTLALPIFQKGTPPYETPDDGGGIALGSGGIPVQRTERVCFSLTVPKGSAPAKGWPLVVYAHGTGGSYRSHIELGLSADFASGEIGGEAVPMAVLGFDGVLHGPRRGASTAAPEGLVFNILNPRAARDNALQAAADLFAVARALPALGEAAPLDGAKVGLYGHSQGGNAAATAAGYEPGYGAVALSGTGGTVVLTLVHKTKPVNVSALLAAVLADPAVRLADGTIDAKHPVLNLLQMFFERADPVNFGRRITVEPAMGSKPRHLLHVYGTGDSYSPVETQRSFAQAAGLPVAAPAIDDFGLPLVMPPVTANLDGGGMPVTALQVQFRPLGYDGHFVSTQHAGARRAIREMLGTFARDGVPTVTSVGP